MTYALFAASPLASDAWQKLQDLGNEFLAHWVLYLIWAGLFCATFTLMRMLVTRWGDSRVTMKAVVLSLLVHLVAGLWTTTVKIATVSLAPYKRDSVPIRRLVKENVQQEHHSEHKAKGNTPIWEKLPAPQREEMARLDKVPQELMPLKAPDKQTQTLETPAVELPDLPQEPDRPTSVPKSFRSARKSSQPAEGTKSPIDEESAEARAEQAASSKPLRESRSVAGLTRSDIKRQSRPGTTTDNSVELKSTPNLAAMPVPADPRATIRRGAEADSPARRAGPAPAELPTDNPGAPAKTGQTELGQGTTTSKSFSRLARRTPGTNEAGSTSRLPQNSSPQSTDAVPGAVIASRTGIPNASPEEMRPSRVPSPLGGVIPRNAGRVPATYQPRKLRHKIAMEMGATEASERAVELSLNWLANHQDPEGCWSATGFAANCPSNDRCPGPATRALDPNDPKDAKLNTPERQRSGIDSDSGLTALSMLAFLGAGYTHEEGIYADNLDRALRWLIAQQTSEGFLGGKAHHFARMYCHGMATIALGEAFGMTNDASLREPLSRAIQFIVDTQNTTDGGWRYSPGQASDMSMFGWQLMALKSAGIAGVEFPTETRDLAIQFLKKAGRGPSGGLAAYRIGERIKPSMTAEALFSRQLLGMNRDNPAAAEAVAFLLQHPPRQSEQDLYYWYYGTLAMYHHGGQPWRTWNAALRDNLVDTQRSRGHAAGSWDPHAPWGDYGGRVFTTALSTLCLEVYYRFLPLYQVGGSDQLNQE